MADPAGMTIAEEDEDVDSLPDLGVGVTEDRPAMSADELNHQLAAAVASNDAVMLSQALEAGADPCFRDDRNWNPLLWASFYGHEDVSTI